MLVVDTEGRHIAVRCQHIDQAICLIINLPAGHRLEADIVEGGIAEVVLRHSIVGSTSWRLDESCDCQWCSIWRIVLWLGWKEWSCRTDQTIAFI